MLKDSIRTSVSLSRLTAEEERHFYRLLVQADDYGCFQAHPSIMRANGYPLMLDAVSDAQVESWTKALLREGIVHLYEGQDKRYGHFANWDRYQTRRGQPSRKFPEPDCDHSCLLSITSDYSGLLPITQTHSSITPSETEAGGGGVDVVEDVDAPSLRSGGTDVPRNLRNLKEWKGYVRDSKKTVGALVDMARAMGEPNADGGKVSGLLKAAGNDSDYAATVLWQASGKEPGGSIVGYALGIVNNKGTNGSRPGSRRVEVNKDRSIWQRPWKEG